MSPEDMFEVFGDFDPSEHAGEVEQRWSGPLLDESRRRTSRYRKEDWSAISAEGGDLLGRFAEAKRAGEAPDGVVATGLAEEHRLHIDRWFYPCSHEQHRNLGGLYVADDRFAAYWDGAEDGLSGYVRASIEANAAAHT